MHLRKEVLVFALFVAMCLIPLSSATELGVNYYHESMMSDQWKQAYIPVSLTQAGLDFDNIKTISKYVKFYINPFVQGNLEWASSLISLANQKGLHSALSIIVEDRQLTYSNWGDYSSKVVSVCKSLNGKVEEIHVGSEISLHSSFSNSEIKDKVVSLISQCQQVFTGKVSYQAFWYEKDAWKGYNAPISFMMYENLDGFKTNLNEMNTLFGSKASIGEWGVSLLDGSIEHDDWWQRDQFKQRWDLIQKTSSQIAYIFAYREPSWNGFGIVRPDGIKRPLWDLFNQTTVSQPVSTTTNSPLLSSLSTSCKYNGNTECSKTSDSISGNCRSISFSTSSGAINILACAKSTGIEMYRNSYPTDVKFSACLGSSCVNEITGFTIVSTTTQTTSTTQTLLISTLPISCNVNGQSCSTKTDTTSGSCRTILSSSSAGDIKVQGCDKGNGWVELYLQQAPSSTNYKLCFANGCITNLVGFVKFQPSSSTQTTQTPKIINVSSLSVSVSPSGTKVGDYIEGTGCRKVQFSSSAGWLEARICPKTDKYEMYFLSGTQYASICVGSSCVSASKGFVSFT